ncbi:YHYH protein [Planctobacterium marinum]|uniref:YHYH protein n=1 Tax=Planctobacterium marinum TaxID=1631968 RepID=UPI0030C6E871
MNKIIVMAAFQAALIASASATQYDYDGDGIADVAVRRSSTYYWYVLNTGDDNFNSDAQDGIQRTQFGKDTADIPVPADYDGDGITDFAVRRPSTFTWYVKNSSGDNINSEAQDGIQRVIFGKNASDIPVPADYDGDGIADFAVRRASTFTWYIKNSDGSNYNSDAQDGIQRIVFGKNSEDVPVPGLYDEDNIADVAVWRASNSTWYIKNSSGSNYNSENEDGIQRLTLGQDGDIPVPADYDNDGITDIAVRRPDTFTWYIRYSSDGEVREFVLGKDEADIPVPADYDGDGAADVAVRRSSNQYFYILNSSDSEIQRINFGKQADDIPTNAPITEVIAKLNAVNSAIASNSVPVADAGSDQTVDVGSTVQLNGANSTDTDGDSLSYNWSFSSRPDSSEAQLSSASIANPTFTADVIGSYVLSLTVNDGEDSSNADSVTITAEQAEPDNTPPIADAGPDQQVSVNEEATLSGAGSSDADGDALSFSWSLISQPANSSASLSRRASETPSITPDIAGTYEIRLTVSDGSDSSTDDITITAVNDNVDIKDIEFVNRSGDCGDYEGTYYASVTDVQEATNFTNSVTISASTDTCDFIVNEIPNHDFNEQGNFASVVAEQNGDYSVTRTPEFASTVTELSLTTTNAITLNGVVIDLLSAACYSVGNEPLGEEKIGCGNDQIDNPWRYDPMSSLNNFGTDEHNAHPQPDGTYHYHGDPLAMYDLDCETSGLASPVIGFAADGFPIYGPCFDDNGTVRKAEPSYVLKSGERQEVSGYTTPVGGQGNVASSEYDGQFTGDWMYSEGAGDLDECNGMEVDGQYGYYITETHPWILKCYKGTPNSSFDKRGRRALRNLLHRHEPNGKLHNH